LTRTVLLVGLLTAILRGLAFAQAPLGPEFLVADPDFVASLQAPVGNEGATCDANAVCILVWGSAQPEGIRNHGRIWAATIDSAGVFVARKIVSNVESFEGVRALALDRGFALLWDRIHSDGSVVPVLRLFDESLEPQSDAIALPFHGPSRPGKESSYASTYAFTRTTAGYVLLSPGFVTEDRLGVFLYFVDHEGNRLRERVLANQFRSDFAVLPQFLGGGLAQDGLGNLIVTYFKRVQGKNGLWDVFVRRFSADGEPLGDEQRVNTYRADDQLDPQVAASPDGGFLVAWQSKGQDGSDDGIYARGYSKQGWPLGPEFRVNDRTFSAQRLPRVAADALGNYFVGWSSFPTDEIRGWEVQGKAFRHDLTPIGGEFHLNQMRLYDQMLASVAFSPDGTLIALWSSTNPRQTNGQDIVPVARRFALSPP